MKTVARRGILAVIRLTARFFRHRGLASALSHLTTREGDSAVTQPNNLWTPWSLHFDQDGTEDVAVIFDARGHDLVTSRHFWLPEGNDPVPPTLAAVRAMHAAPELLAACKLALAFLESATEANGRLACPRAGRRAELMRALRAVVAEAEGGG